MAAWSIPCSPVVGRHTPFQGAPPPPLSPLPHVAPQASFRATSCAWEAVCCSGRRLAHGKPYDSARPLPCVFVAFSLRFAFPPSHGRTSSFSSFPSDLPFHPICPTQICALPSPFPQRAMTLFAHRCIWHLKDDVMQFVCFPETEAAPPRPFENVERIRYQSVGTLP